MSIKTIRMRQKRVGIEGRWWGISGLPKRLLINAISKTGIQTDRQTNIPTDVRYHAVKMSTYIKSSNQHPHPIWSPTIDLCVVLHLCGKQVRKPKQLLAVITAMMRVGEGGRGWILSPTADTILLKGRGLSNQ